MGSDRHITPNRIHSRTRTRNLFHPRAPAPASCEGRLSRVCLILYPPPKEPYRRVALPALHGPHLLPAAVRPNICTDLQPWRVFGVQGLDWGPTAAQTGRSWRTSDQPVRSHKRESSQPRLAMRLVCGQSATTTESPVTLRTPHSLPTGG